MREKALVEAALYVADRPLSLARLSQTLGLPERLVLSALREIGDELEAEDRGLELTSEAGGFVLRVKKDLVEAVKPFAPQQDIPDPVLRTLAVVVHLAPVLQSEVVKIRGERAYGHVKELVDRGFVQARTEGPTKVLTVAQGLLDYFGVATVEELRAHLGQPEGGALLGSAGPSEIARSERS